MLSTIHLRYEILIKTKNPITRVFEVEDIQITALAIPSPGSAQRQLTQFGFEGLDRKIYAVAYFKNAFNWLNN